MPLSHLEVWVSRERARWGTRAAQFDVDEVGLDGRIVLRLTEGSGTFSLDHAEGRFLFLRGFHEQDDSHILKIGSLRAYRRTTNRRLGEEEEQVLEEETELLVFEPEPPPASPPNEAPPAADLAALMLFDLTTAICNTTDEEDHHLFAQHAATLWANLREPEGLHCFDCEYKTPVRCERYFSMLNTRQTQRARRREQQRAAARAHVEATYREAILEHLDKSCCRKRISTGEVDCSRNYCMEAQKQAAQAKTARVLRQLHEEGHDEAQLGLTQLLATDGLSSHYHPHAPCRDGTLSLLSSECVSESLIHHVLKKHNVARDVVDKYLGKAGLDLTQVVLSTMGIKQTMSEKTQNWWKSKQEAASQGRRTQEQPVPRRRRTRAAPKTNAGVSAFQRDLKSYMNKSAVHARNLQKLGGKKTPGRQAQQHSFVDTLTAVVSQQGSMVRTVLQGGRSVADALRRFPKPKPKPPAKPTPKHGAKHIKGFFDHVDSLVQEGRRLDEGFGDGITIPETSPRWLLELDWPGHAAEIHRLAKILRKRDAHILDHARRLRQLPHGDVAHETGNPYFDVNVPPSAMGNALRRFAGWISDTPYDFEHAEEARKMPRATNSEPSDIWEFVKGGMHPLTAVKSHLETTSRHLNPRRSLAEAIFGTAARLPATTNSPVVSRYGSYGNSGGGSIFQGFLRYILFDTLLCYLCTPLPFVCSAFPLCVLTPGRLRRAQIRSEKSSRTTLAMVRRRPEAPLATLLTQFRLPHASRYADQDAPVGQENAAIRLFPFPSCNYSRALPFHPHRLCFPASACHVAAAHSAVFSHCLLNAAFPARSSDHSAPGPQVSHECGPARDLRLRTARVCDGVQHGQHEGNSADAGPARRNHCHAHWPLAPVCRGHRLAEKSGALGGDGVDDGREGGGPRVRHGATRVCCMPHRFPLPPARPLLSA